MNMGVGNCDVNGGHFYMNIPTGYESNNHISVDSTKKRDEISPNIYEIENNGLLDSVDIDVMLPV